MKKKRQEYPLKRGENWYDSTNFPPIPGEWIITYQEHDFYDQFSFKEMKEGEGVGDIKCWRHATEKEFEKFATPEEKRRKSRRYTPDEL